ncbi:MAG: LysM peptidoglycan-binding domain-containing protein, partial [Terracidiphilus sp.]
LYTARRGDTLVTIADRFGVSLNQLRRWNKMTCIKVEPGSRLHVAEPVVAARVSSGHRRRVSTTGAKAQSAGHSTATSRVAATHQSAAHRAAAKPVAKKRSSAQK